VSVSGADRAPPFDHLHHLTDARGLFEHALHGEPRLEHGYCLDDVARALVVVYRQSQPNPKLLRAGRRYLEFALSAIQDDGSCHNRMTISGAWSDTPGLGDWWGRAIWGLGVTAAHAPSDATRARAILGFRTAARQRSPHPLSMAFAALGAGEVLLSRPDELSARALLRDFTASVDDLGGARPRWPWPRPRLAYGNGSVVEALLLAGAALPDLDAHQRGLELLDFLLCKETHDGHLSVTPVGGRGPHDLTPGFDQQPIEVAALADACGRAFDITGDVRWLDGVRMAWAWFLGDNDVGTPMFDPETGGGFDGLHETGPNLNQGAESTLALLSTVQQARRLGVLS